MYVQVFIVITELARAAQPGDITFTPGPCSLIPRRFWIGVPAAPVTYGSCFPAQPTWPPYTEYNGIIPMTVFFKQSAMYKQLLLQAQSSFPQVLLIQQ